jgi:hypothetical protein
MLELLNQLDGFASDDRIKVKRRATVAAAAPLVSAGMPLPQPQPLLPFSEAAAAVPLCTSC